MSAARVSAYKQYTENQKSRNLIEILQYHPIGKKEIQKLKLKVLCKFQAKVTGVALVVQMIASLIAYKTITIDNFEYIILNIFIVVVMGELIIEWFSGAFEKE